MRRPQVGELGEQITMRPDLIRGHLPICEDGKEGILDVVGECPAIVGEGRRARGVIGQDVRQQCPLPPALHLPVYTHPLAPARARSRRGKRASSAGSPAR